MITPLHVPLILTHLAESAPLLQQDWRETALHPDGHASADQWPSAPGVSIIVPTRDEACMLAGLVSLLDRLSYSGPVELLVVDNGSVEPATAKLFEQLEHRPATRVLAMPGPFNFAALINQAASQSSHDYLCLLNNDVEPRDGEWLERMMHEAVRPGVGAVGARLLYPDGTIQHVGVAVGLGGAAGHVQKGVHPDTSQFNSWHGALRRVSAVTAACLVVSKAKFDAVGGLDAEAFAVDFNDVDFCLKLDRAGWANLVEPAATLLHHESKSRGRGHRGAAEHRFALELTVLQDRWQTRTMIDPWFSSLFSRTSERCVLST
jgi:GT2 family glycosyltransferase